MGFGKADSSIAVFALLFLGGLFLISYFKPEFSPVQMPQEYIQKRNTPEIIQIFPHASDSSDPYPSILVPPDDPDTSNHSTNIPAAFLVAPFYTSNSTNYSADNTRFSITNTGNSSEFVHIIFIDGSGCFISDAIIALTPRQPVHFNTTSSGPDVSNQRGLMIVFPINSTTGYAVGHNTLIGDVAFKTSEGYHGGYNMVGFRSISGSMGPPGILPFDDVTLEKWPDTVILPEFPSLADNNFNHLILVSPHGGSLPLGFLNSSNTTFGGTVYNETPAEASFTFNKTICFSQSEFADGSFPGIPGGINSMVPTGQSGWMKISKSNGSIPIIGLYMNRNPDQSTDSDAYSGARILPGTCSGACPSFNLTYPTFD
ncbi:MAG: hypothetical protein MN733_06100, partial [Nitrososphaera sp.]|nr:hypothetical protein [Nitrososphaera sp.]